MANTNLNQQFESNILNYGEEVKTISSFVDAVRKTVGQYLGYNDTRGHINMIREIIQNSYDEMVKIASPCHDVWVDYDENTMQITVRDTGRGIPFDNLVRIFSQQHTSSNYEKKLFEYSSGRHGVGSKVTNACSKIFIVESYRFTGEARRIEFHEGKPWSKGEIKIPNKNKYQGSSVTFIPSLQVMKDLHTTSDDVLQLASTLLYLTPSKAELNKQKINAVNTLHYRGVLKNGSVVEKTIRNEDGILSFLIASTDKPVIPPIILAADNGRIKMDIAFTYDEKNLGDDSDIISFANMCPTVNEKSEHVIGFTAALSNYFRNYMNKIFLTKGKTKCIGGDILSGLKAVVTVSHLEPIFSGQAKEIFSGEGVKEFITSELEKQLNEWIKFNGNELQRLCKYYKDVADLRMAEEVNKTNFIKKVKVSASTGLPSDYHPPAGKEHLELLIAEGKSAVSSVKNAIDPRRQGVYPIRGKIINAFTNPKAKVLANEEVCGIAAIMKAGIGKNFDINKCPFEKIIFCGDADPDGKNIRQLLMKLFLMYFRPLIEEGRVYMAQPPLYSINVGTSKKPKKKFFTEKTDYIKYLQTEFSSRYALYNDKKKKISPKDIVSIVYSNSDYVNDMNIMANNYAADPQLLEYIIRYRKMPFEWQRKFFKKEYRFLDVKKSGGTMVLDGLVGEQYYTIVCSDQLYIALSGMYHYIDNSLEYYYLEDGKKITLYQLMNIFENFKPSSIQRYKGLGEMPPQDLKVSAIHPDYDRSLLQLTVTDIKKQIQEIRNIQSDLSVLLKDIDMTKFEF